MIQKTVNEGNLRLTAGIVAFILASWYLVEAFNMPLGSLSSPGPGLFPRGVGLAGVLISLLLIFESLTPSNQSRRTEIPSRRELKTISLFLVAFVAYIVLLPVLGQHISATIFGIASVAILSDRSWYIVIPAGAAIGISISVIFVSLFGVPLPTLFWN